MSFKALAVEETLELIALRSHQLITHRQHSYTVDVGLFSILKLGNFPEKS